MFDIIEEIILVTIEEKSSVIKWHTGRETSFYKTHKTASTWFAEEFEAFKNNPIATQLKSELLGVREVDLRAVNIFYRGRDFEKDNALRLAASEYGPPPLGKQESENRYNKKTEPVLYLATSLIGVHLESNAVNTGNKQDGSQAEKPLYSARYDLSEANLKIADLCSLSKKQDLLNHVFDLSENLALTDYCKSQQLAKWVQEAGFDGMLVPGVRGRRGSNYQNLVIFNPLKWHNWIDPSFAIVQVE